MYQLHLDANVWKEICFFVSWVRASPFLWVSVCVNCVSGYFFFYLHHIRWMCIAIVCWAIHFNTEHVLMFVMFKIVQRKQIDAIAEYLINIFIFPFFFLHCFHSVTICLNQCRFTSISIEIAIFESLARTNFKSSEYKA